MKERKQQKNMIMPQAQATIEFAFAFVVAILIFYSCVRVIQWVGVALVNPGLENEASKRNSPADNDAGSVLGESMGRFSGELPEPDFVFKNNVVHSP
jgi:hypothetical protein